MFNDTPSHVVMERYHLYTALGIRFWDAVMGRNADNLLVMGQRVNAQNQLVGRPIRGQRTTSGVYAFLGLHPAENTSKSDQEHNLPKHQAVITVNDPTGRFLPIAFKVTIPHKGVFLGTPALIPNGLTAGLGVYLFSAPSRPMPEGMAFIHGQIVEGGKATDPKPARFALVKITSEELRLDTSGGPNPNGGLSAIRVPITYYGMTDKNGVLNLPLPYPAVEEGDTVPLVDHAFTLNLEIFYNPTTQANDGLPPSIKLDDDIKIPNFSSIVQQEQARIGTAYDKQAETLTIPTAPEDFQIQLAYEVPLTLRTPAAPSNSIGSYFRILPS